jgi:hypothetical protein
MDEINRLIWWMWVLVLSFPALAWLGVAIHSRQYHLRWLFALALIYAVVFAVMR